MHLSVCICTFQRVHLLRRLLGALQQQATGGDFTFSIVVADNDPANSARSTIAEFARRSSLQVAYYSEPRRNLALVRNRVLAHAHGEWVALIDDDEFPARDWLQQLLMTARRLQAPGVLGPVRPHFEAPPPRWLQQGRFCERAEYPTGTVMHWSKCFAGNALLRRDVLAGMSGPFRTEFGLGGEDVDLFRRLTRFGHRFVWCNEAVVHEIVPPCRWTRAYWMKRALLHGSNSAKQCCRTALVKSLIAIPTYSLVLPGSALLGQHVSLKIGMKLAGHFGRLVSSFGLTPVRQRPP